jgi:hypothetical protein
MMKIVWKEEGMAGFYSGVAGMALGQALIKAMAFGSNNWALNAQGLGDHSLLQVAIDVSFLQ